MLSHLVRQTCTVTVVMLLLAHSSEHVSQSVFGFFFLPVEKSCCFVSDLFGGICCRRVGYMLPSLSLQGFPF